MTTNSPIMVATTTTTTPNMAARRKPMLDIPRNVMVKEKPNKRRAPPNPESSSSPSSPVSVSSDASSVTDVFGDLTEEQHQRVLQVQNEAAAVRRNNINAINNITSSNSRRRALVGAVVSGAATPATSTPATTPPPVAAAVSGKGRSESKKASVLAGGGRAAGDDEPEPDTKELLEYASLRVAHQRLRGELAQLKQVLAHKEEQIGQLTGQLRRATASKCDLVVACTEMERKIEAAVRHGDGTEAHTKYLEILEGRADMEREFMNELQALTNQLLTIDRKYLNELCDKDFTIGQLQEQNRRLNEELYEMKDRQKIQERKQAIQLRHQQQ